MMNEFFILAYQGRQPVKNKPGTMSEQTLIILLILTGMGHIAVAVGSLAVPTLLGWKKHLDIAPPLLRQVFWTYSAYIKLVTIAFGVVSIFGARELIGASFLAKSVNLFVIIYWVGRLGVEFIYYDRSELKGIARISDLTLNVFIVFFIIVHALAFGRNIQLM
jgi:hypothetical protein